jgi:hypothetical protein
MDLPKLLSAKKSWRVYAWMTPWKTAVDGGFGPMREIEPLS